MGANNRIIAFFKSRAINRAVTIIRTTFYFLPEKLCLRLNFIDCLAVEFSQSFVRSIRRCTGVEVIRRGVVKEVEESMKFSATKCALHKTADFPGLKLFRQVAIIQFCLIRSSAGNL